MTILSWLWDVAACPALEKLNMLSGTPDEQRYIL